MSDIVLNAGECMLFGMRLPVLGGVRETVVTPFAQKVTQGDYSRDDRVIESSWIVSQFNGGMGIEFGQFPKDQDRWRFGNLETRYRNLMLGPQVTLADPNGADALFITAYAGQLYVVTAGEVLRWGGAGLTSLYTFPSGLGTPTAVLQVNSQLWTQCQNGVAIYDGAAFSAYYNDGVNPSAVDLPGVAAVVWDDKVFRLAGDGRLWYFVIPPAGTALTNTFYSTDWVACGRLHVPDGYCNQLLLFFDLTGDLVIHAVTKVGLFGYDFASYKFYPTAMTFPYTQSAGQGAIVWRGEVYVPAGATPYKYNGSTVQNVGPSRDDGLPQQLQGDIVRLVEGHGFYFAVIQAKAAKDAGVAADVDEARFANPLARDVMAQQPATQGAIICSPGVSWHTLFYESAGASMGAAAVATTNEGFRLWFSTSRGLYYTDLTAELHNPLQNPTATYKPAGFVETPWVDLGWAEVSKLALYVEVFAKNCSPTETISISLAYDDSPNYALLGTVTRDGKTVLPIGGNPGKLFKNVRMKIEMARDPNNPGVSPVLRSANLSYMRRPDLVWGFEVQIAAGRGYEGRSAREVIQHLKTVAADKKTGSFIYRDEVDNTVKEGRVVFSRLVGAQQSGRDAHGRYTISLIEVREPENE